MRVKLIDTYRRVKEAHRYDRNRNLIPSKHLIVFNQKPFFLFHNPKGIPRSRESLISENPEYALGIRKSYRWRRMRIV